MSESNTNSALTNADAFSKYLASLTQAPAWLKELKEKAWAQFETLPEPNRKNENWRFATLSGLELDGYQAVAAAPESTPSKEAITETAGRLEYVDDILVSEEALSEELKAKGVIFAPLARAIDENEELVRKHLFERLPDIGSEKYQALHQSLFVNGVFLYVPRGVVIEKPFIVVHNTLKDGSAIFPHTLFVTEENAEATLVDLFQGEGETKHYVCGMADIYAGQAARSNYRAIQNWNKNTLAFHLNSVTAERDTSVKTINVHLGGARVRNEQHGRVLGQGADVHMDSLGIVRGEQELDQRTLQTHSAPGATSNLLYKNALLDNARTIFSGLIRVDEVAQQTDAYQTNRNLLLSPTADANSMPGLEIEANDVKCSHGATTGQLDESELFYFLARGITREKAQELMVFGFFEEIVQKFDNEALADYVRNLVEKKFTQK
jgi:Fe-S cluster assembly protein SufD